MAAAHLDYGRTGEDLAAAWYVAHGYRILDRNWRCRIGEIDLVLQRNGVVVVSEVKARRSAAFGVPALAVGRAKQQRLRRLAAAWLTDHRVRRGGLRFDVVAVTDGEVEVYMNAF